MLPEKKEKDCRNYGPQDQRPFLKTMLKRFFDRKEASSIGELESATSNSGDLSPGGQNM